MTTPHYVLAATDLSAPARLAAERAALLSKETRSLLKLLHVANLSYLERLQQLVATAPSGLKETVLATARLRLQELGDDIASRHGIKPDLMVVTGSPLAELLKKIHDTAADLVVCGARGESAVRHVLVGSTAQRLLSRTRCPVLVVKQPPLLPYQSVLVPVDFSPSSLRAIEHARAVAPHAGLTLLHVFEVPFEGHMRYASVDEEVIRHYRDNAKLEATRKMQALSEEAGLPPGTFSVLVMHGDPTSRITDQERAQAADLIVIGKHGESMLEELLLGSVTKYVLAESQCDVLISVLPDGP